MGPGATIAVELKRRAHTGRNVMGRSILLFLLGVPIPIIILIALLHH
jgi:hypothetical protein